MARTPSPTPSEENLLHGIRPKTTTKQKIQYALIIVVIIAIGVLIGLHRQIVKGLSPTTKWLHDHKFAPLIPIALIIIVSFPPLFGAEIIATLVGITWSLPASLGIVAVGTLLGEIANFFTFKYTCSTRNDKIEAKNLDYGLMAYVVRRGGFLIVLIIRYSAVPPHFATALFATVGVSFWIFFTAAILSLPKQIIGPVYVGYVMQPSIGRSSHRFGPNNTIDQLNR
ncbi:hypothetical protein DFH07DRAFT_753278 [Mycena maculata]|uniref:Golgi apparatus membrane protein TVP38 n=1 Tax=Mycena maculata TaxID=230809 RepID=A0AAD7I9A7_9AGAR|nr:hypothetical protein DFH07DRAFT_753278 [Mycena maculata]